MNKKTIIADSQYLISTAIQSLIGSENCITAESVNHLYRLLGNDYANLIVADGLFFGDDYLFHLKRIKKENPCLPILFLANELSVSELAELTKAGIKNIIFKTAMREEVLSAIDFATKGKKYFDSEALELIMDANERKNSIEDSVQLTTSEIEIIRLISGGLTTKEIAERRNVSFHTVNTHRKNIFRKMEVNNASELIMKSIKAGIIDNIEYFI